MRFALSKEALKTQGRPSRAQIFFSASATRKQSSGDSITQGPATRSISRPSPDAQAADLHEASGQGWRSSYFPGSVHLG